MCFGGGSTPPPQQAPAPPPPDPMEAPAAPAFNEDMTNATNADAAVSGSRRGRKALRVDLNAGTRTNNQAATPAASSSASGLNIPA